MTSWQLWRTLRNPPLNHPLFHRTVIAQNVSFRSAAIFKNRVYLYPLIVLVILLSALTGPSLLKYWFSFVFIVSISFPFLVLAAPFLYPLALILQSALWASNIGYALAAAREEGRYDLLCLFSNGSLGANWAIASGCMHRGFVFDVFYGAARFLLLLGTAIVAFLVFIALLGVTNPAAGKAGHDVLAAVRLIMDAGAMVAAYGLHYVQTKALSPLAGMFVATTTRNRVQAQQGAFGFVWAAQAGTYLFFWLASETVLPFVYDRLPLGNGFVTLSVPVASFALLYIIREGSIAWLWRVTAQRLNVDSGDPDALMALREETGLGDTNWLTGKKKSLSESKKQDTSTT